VADYVRPLPLPDSDTQEYWNGTQAHELRAQRCSSCGRLRWPPQGFCPYCYSWDFNWTNLSQTGTIQSYVVIHQAIAAFAEAVPYAVARVMIDNTDEAVILTSSVIDVPWEEVKVGMRVRAAFDDVTPEVTLPRFRPSRTSASRPVPAEAEPDRSTAATRLRSSPS
jgi:uncharacterized OB-fold protein